MLRVVCADGRARGMFSFYGANRTGRFAGRLIQLQNLPQNHLDDLAELKEQIRTGVLSMVGMTITGLILWCIWIQHHDRKSISQ